MDIKLTGTELNLAITEYVQRRGIPLNAVLDIKITAGRSGNPNIATVTILQNAQDVHKEVIQIYEPIAQQLAAETELDTSQQSKLTAEAITVNSAVGDTEIESVIDTVESKEEVSITKETTKTGTSLFGNM